jgi:hypothetical protein
MKKTLYIHDELFAHASTSSWYNESELFEWLREYDKDFLVFTDNSIMLSDSYDNKRKYAWLVESPEINPNIYEYIKANSDKFNLVFTFDKELLELSSKFKIAPFGGCWINEEDRKIHNKTKLLSAIFSSKRSTSGHSIRAEIEANIPNLDYFGNKNRIENKIEGLRDYHFSVVVENTKRDYYFTEKLIDCFVTGTIPIYWGCPSIGNFFDSEGIITFDTVDELRNIIDTLTVEQYEAKLEAVKNNFVIAKNYLICDDIIYKILKRQENL